MKRIVPFALLIALLLWGCGSPAQSTESTAPSEAATQATEPPTLPSEIQDSVTTFQLESGNCAGILPFSQNSYALLTTTGQMRLLSGENLRIDNSRDLGCQLSSEDPSILVKEDQISYFDSSRGAYVTLGKNLTEIASVTIRDAIVAGPIMSEDFSTVYYCTAEGVRALDMATGNSRMLRQEHGSITSLDGILFGGSILRYTRLNEQGVDDTIFIRTSDGSQVYFANLDGQLSTWGNSYAAVMQLQLPMGTVRQILTGDLSGTIANLEIGESWDTILFPGSGTALIQDVMNDELTVQLYNLSDGTLAASRVFSDHCAPFPHSWFDGRYLWLWNNEESLLHRWEVSQNACTSDSYFAHHYTLSDPDETGLENCRGRAQMLSETFGIPITLAEMNNRTSGADYTGYPDLRPSQYLTALNLLHDALEKLPEGLTRLLGGDGGLCIELVDDFDPVHGIQPGTGTLEFGSPRIIRVSMCQDLQAIFYHELFHALELMIQSESNDLEDWNSCNPKDFDYTGSVSAWEAGQYTDSEYLAEGENYFADDYCFVSPREDRAQTFMYAMLDGQQARFQSKAMQSKLEVLSKAFRDAFRDYEDLEVIFPWEQYMDDTTPW